MVVKAVCEDDVSDATVCFKLSPMKNIVKVTRCHLCDFDYMIPSELKEAFCNFYYIHFFTIKNVHH